jgi:hypothetical protein
MFGMILVFTTCTFPAYSGDVPVCHQRNIPIASEDPLTPQQCMATAQPQLAHWCETHPGWWVKRWACQRHDPEKSKA